MHSLRLYLSKQQLCTVWQLDPADPALGLVVVIPCYDEPDLLQTLESLNRCQRPRCAVEIVLVWNASERDDEALRCRNLAMMEQVRTWQAEHEVSGFRLQLLNFPRLVAKHAGVGLARKIGMDYAVGRFVGAQNPRGVIASLDADCRCDTNYLISLESHFEQYAKTRACTIYFEHAMHGPLARELYDAIIQYELFLRYYRHGLQYANFPFAHYTVGSCLAVRCDFYARHGGMNRRKAGEDFYFMNKLMAVGGVSDNTSTRVMPGVRESTRTPFGTGRALHDWMNAGCASWQSYDARVFRDLAGLVCCVDTFYGMTLGKWQAPRALSDTMKSYLLAQDIVARHREMRTHCASRESFRRRFFQWFDGFRALKFIHHATREAYPRKPLEQACRELLAWQEFGEQFRTANAKELLLHFRHRDRQPRASAGARSLANTSGNSRARALQQITAISEA